MRRSIGLIAVIFFATFFRSLPSSSEGLAQPGASVAVFDFFNLSDDASYDEWESLFGRGVRRGLFTHKEIEVVPYPTIHTALADLQVDDYFITPEQIPPIGAKIEADLAVLGSFNVEEGVVACSLKVVDAKTGKVLAEDIRFGSKDEAEAFLRELESGLEKLLIGEAGETQPPSPAPAALESPPAVTPEETTAEESPWTPITLVAPVGAPVGAPLDPVVEPVPSEPQASVSIQGPGTPSEMVGAEEAGAQQVQSQPAMETVQPAQPSPGAPLQNVLDTAWKRSTGLVPPAPSQGTVSAPQWSSTSLPPPGVAIGNSNSPTSQPTSDPFAPIAGQPAPSVSAQPRPIQSSQQRVGYGTVPPPIEAELPRLQPPPRMEVPPSPFQPMNVLPPPPSQQVQQYPYVPPAPNQGMVPQEPARRGPIGRFFGWMGRRFGGGDTPPDAPSPQSAAPPPQTGANQNLWTNGAQQSKASIGVPGMAPGNTYPEDRILVASLPQPFGALALDVPPQAPPSFPELGEIPPPRSGLKSNEEPFKPKGLAGWGKTYFDAGNYDLAKDSYKKAALDEPENADLHFNLAQAQLASGEEDAAVKSLERAATLRPQDPETLNRLGALQAKRNEWGKAIDTYTTLAINHPSDPEAFNKIGMAFDQAGRPKEALRAFRKALALDPKNAHAAHHASDVFKKLNRPQEAQAYAQLAKSLP